MTVRSRFVPFPTLLAATLLVACGGTAPGGDRSDPNATIPLPEPKPLDVAVEVDEAHAVTQTVPTSGGTISVTAVDGTVYSLEVPADALLQETVITMAPLASVEGAPLAGVPHGVALEPDGLRLFAPATLEVTPAPGAGQHVAGFGTLGGGAEFHLEPVAPGEGTRLELLHFSEHGAFFSEVGPILVEDPVEFMPTDWEGQLQQLLGELLLAEREAKLAGLPGDPDFDWKLEAILRTYFEKVVEPMLWQIRHDCLYAKENVPKALGWSRTVALVGKEDVFTSETKAVMDAVVEGADNCWREATRPCIDQEDDTRFQEALEAARLNQLLGGDPSEYDPFDPELQCEQAWSGTVTMTVERVVHSDVTTEGTCCYGRPTLDHDVLDEVETQTATWTATSGTADGFSAWADFSGSATYEKSWTRHHEGWSSCYGEIVPVQADDAESESGSAAASGRGKIVIGMEDDGSYWLDADAWEYSESGSISGSGTYKFGPLCQGGYDEDTDSWEYPFEPGNWFAYGTGTIDQENPNVIAGSVTTVEEYDDEVITRTVTWNLTRNVE